MQGLCKQFQWQRQWTIHMEIKWSDDDETLQNEIKNKKLLYNINTIKHDWQQSKTNTKEQVCVHKEDGNNANGNKMLQQGWRRRMLQCKWSVVTQIQCNIP